jgi:hypothetical protein
MVDKSFKRIQSFVHQYDFPIGDIVRPYMDGLMEEFEHRPKIFSSTVITKKAVNVKIRNKELIDIFQNKLEEILVNNYEIGEFERVEDSMALYIQNDKEYNSVFHNHIGFGIVAVFYLALPKDGGEIEFVNPPMDTVILKPELDKVYFFPYWLLHRPLKQKSPETRISVNWGVHCTSRPINKISKDMW